MSMTQLERPRHLGRQPFEYPEEQFIEIGCRLAAKFCPALSDYEIVCIADLYVGRSVFHRLRMDREVWFSQPSRERVDAPLDHARIQEVVVDHRLLVASVTNDRNALLVAAKGSKRSLDLEPLRHRLIVNSRLLLPAARAV